MWRYVWGTSSVRKEGGGVSVTVARSGSTWSRYDAHRLARKIADLLNVNDGTGLPLAFDQCEGCGKEMRGQVEVKEGKKVKAKVGRKRA